MDTLDMTKDQVQKEIDRIVEFIRWQCKPDFPVVIGLSGGVDSDLTARLCAKAISANKMRCFTVLQEDFDPKYVNNARNLAMDLKVDLIEIPIPSVPKQLMGVLADSDPAVGFSPNPAFLDVGRAKCAIRTFIFSAYSERGYLVVGPSNRTELELGYFLPFGDALAHFRPIIHLYKTQVRQLAREIGTRPEVISQQPAAGFWIGDEDLKGIAYWLFNEGPIQIDLKLEQSEKEKIQQIRDELSFQKIDQSLLRLQHGWTNQQISEELKLSIPTVEKLRRLTEKALEYKRRPLGVGID